MVNMLVMLLLLILGPIPPHCCLCKTAGEARAPRTWHHSTPCTASHSWKKGTLTAPNAMVRAGIDQGLRS